MNDLTDEKIKVHDVSTGFASETFIVVLSSRSKAATGMMADKKNYLTNNNETVRATISKWPLAAVASFVELVCLVNKPSTTP